MPDRLVDRTPLDHVIATHYFEHYFPNHPAVLKFTLPWSQAARLLTLLNRIGVSAASLFPGYAGVVDSLWESQLLMTNEELDATCPSDEALQSDPDERLKARAADASHGVANGDDVWHEALEGRLPDSPGALREAAATRAAVAALSALQKMIDACRLREGTVPPNRRPEWQAVRGALHQALALRGSRIAVYDLRESLQDAKGHLPTSFLAALHVVGDQSCLEPLAAAYSRADPEDAWWRAQLAAAFRAIARRERVTRRHVVVKRIAARWPDAVRDLTATT